MLPPLSLSSCNLAVIDETKFAFKRRTFFKFSSDAKRRMNYFRFHIVIATVFVAVTPCYAAKPIARDGSTMEKAIPLIQRGPKAVEEEMAWMMKLYHYTPLLASRDSLVEAIRKAKETMRAVHLPPLGSTPRLSMDGSGAATGW